MIPRLILLVIGGYFLATMGYALVQAPFYASDAHRIVRYVLGPGLLGVGFVLAAWRLKPSPRLVAAIYSATIVGSLFLFEVIATARTFGLGSGAAAENSAEAAGAAGFRGALPPGYTLKRLNADLGIETPSEVFLGGIPGQKVLLCHRAEGPVLYTADRYGFRNDDAVHDGDIDVLLLGDSFAEGYCLGEGEHFAAKLGDLGLGVLNTGTRGAGPLFELAILERFGPERAPPWTVMLFYGGNDWENLERAMPLDWLSAAVDGAYLGTPDRPGAERLAAARRLVGEWWAQEEETVISEEVWDATALRNMLALQKTALTLGLHFPKAPVKIPGYAEVFERAARTVGEWGGRLLVVYVPPSEQFTGLLSFPGAYQELPNLVRAATGQGNVDFLDLSEPFARAAHPARLYAPDGHFSVEGAEFAARAVREAMAPGQAP